MSTPISERAAKLHRDALVWDMTFPMMDEGGSDVAHAPLRRMADAGVDFVSVTVALDWDGTAEAVRSIARERAYFIAHSDRYVLVEQADDVLTAKQTARLAVALHFQGTNPVEYDLNMIEVYHRLGVRHMLMAYNAKNAVGDGWIEEGNGGLSRFGRALIGEMNRVGMLVDASHTGYRTTMEMFEVSSDPVIFSHANARALWVHGRNISDEQITACARSGGVVGVVGVNLFLGQGDPSPEALFRHIDYIADRAGPEHVGLGLDYVADQVALTATINARAAWTPPSESFGPIEPLAVRYSQPEELPALTELMLARGYSEANVRGILGENWLRVARRVWG